MANISKAAQIRHRVIEDLNWHSYPVSLTGVRNLMRKWDIVATDEEIIAALAVAVNDSDIEFGLVGNCGELEEAWRWPR